MAENVDDLRRSQRLWKKPTRAKPSGRETVAEVIATRGDHRAEVGIAFVNLLEKRHPESLERQVEHHGIAGTPQTRARRLRGFCTDNLDADDPRIGGETLTKLGVVANDDHSRLRQ